MFQSLTQLVAIACCLIALAAAPLAAQEPIGDFPLLQAPNTPEALPSPPPNLPPEPPATAPATSTPAATPPTQAFGLPEQKVDSSSYFLGSWFDRSYWDPWEGNVELGLNGTDGNSETFNVRFGSTAKYKTDWLERTLQITSIQKSANGVTTANTALIDGRLDWPMPQSRWNYFVHGLAEFDEFKAFDYRLSADTGFGYEFIQTDLTKLIGRAGLAGSQEVGGPNDGFNPELLFGGEFTHQFSPSNKISFKIDYYPTIDDFADYRINSQASWETVLAAEWGLSLKFSLIDRYDSTPHGARPNDLDYSTMLLWSF